MSQELKQLKTQSDKKKETERFGHKVQVMVGCWVSLDSRFSIGIGRRRGKTKMRPKGGS